MSLDEFNVIAGIVTIASLFFSAWTYWSGKSKEAVEKQRLYEYFTRLQSGLSLVEAAINQAKLIGSISDKDETTKKELKHLDVALLASLMALYELMARGMAESKTWSFGIPDRYFQLDKEQLATKVEKNKASNDK